MGRNKVSLLEEELVQFSIKSLLVVPTDSPTLSCSVWTRQSYNPDSFRAQMKSIWKMIKKFVTQVARKNLFLIIFYNENDLKLIMEGMPWLFPVQIDVQKPLRRGVFVVVDSQEKKERSDGGFPYSVALKVESNLVGKESLLFEFFTKKSMKQYQYTNGVEMGIGSEVNDGGKDVEEAEGRGNFANSRLNEDLGFDSGVSIIVPESSIGRVNVNVEWRAKGIMIFKFLIRLILRERGMWIAHSMMLKSMLGNLECYFTHFILGLNYRVDIGVNGKKRQREDGDKMDE
ncbi:hypothetical protein Goarm_010201 [Gossypium armourianum]|uniref:DUF4283 domain-containing protein n=1 Tax=Gossypium armourianum TaxID=34283 RepID=A0A7J9JVB1_9ROSI|nr:hypothetical protein [Gossypium armourianum]